MFCSSSLVVTQSHIFSLSISLVVNVEFIYYSESEGKLKMFCSLIYEVVSIIFITKMCVPLSPPLSKTARDRTLCSLHSHHRPFFFD